MIAPLACVIPAYQAAGTLGAVAAGLRRALPGARLIVVDDGSTDGTREVARRVCDEVIVFGANRGKGAALRAGAAAALRGGARAVVTIDADGQHEPENAPALVQALAGAHIAVGVRARRGSAMPLRRRLTNVLASRAMSAVAGAPLPDAQCGFRALRREVLETVVAVGDRYEYETDLLLRATRAGYVIANVPVATLYGAPSHFHPVQDSLLVIRTIWRHRGSRRAPATAPGRANALT